ncbi:MAG TPA: hypothetical protein VHP56_06745 [Solirubrobacterales bacterium]|jgi:hypothetical protein|nr:hypothetical protein [Solirubrobacterales bacterium]
MKRTSQLAALVAAAVAVLALAATAVTAAGPGETVKVKSEVTLGASGYQGKVKSANSNCVGERTVVLKQKGNGVLSRSTSKPNGNWRADLDALNENLEIPAMVYAEVKPSTQATAGPIYKCLGAVSKTVEIAGG